MMNASTSNTTNPTSNEMPTTPVVAGAGLPPSGDKRNDSMGSSTTTVIPPQVLPSHGTPHTQAHKPATAPHISVDSLGESLASKINGESATTGSTGSVPPSSVAASASSEDAPPTSGGGVPKKGFSLKTAVAGLVVVLLLLGAGATYYLTQTSQDIRQRASNDVVYPSPSTAPTGSPCQQGLFSCAGRSPSDCSSHNEGQGCYYSQSESTCKCGGNSGTNPQSGGTCNASGGKATVCAGSTALNICVVECNQSGDPGDSCNYGCGGGCTNKTVPANTCQTFGNSLSCGKWQTDVHGDVSCSDSDCSRNGCTTATPTPTPGTGGGPVLSAVVQISQANCLNTGKYQTGSAITLTGLAVNTTNSRLYLAKLNAAGTDLDNTFNANCPIGVPHSTDGKFCLINEAAANTSARWTPTVTGKYVLVVNGTTATAACSGNPNCNFNGGSDNLIPVAQQRSCPNFVSCSDIDFKYFEVVNASACVTPTPTPVAPVTTCGGAITQTNQTCGAGLVEATTFLGKYCAKPEYKAQCETMNLTSTPAKLCCEATTAPVGVVCGGICSSGTPCQNGLVCTGTDSGGGIRVCSRPENASKCTAAGITEKQTACCSMPETAGPMCLNITAQKSTGEALAANTELKVGDQIKFTCGSVTGITQYAFRIKYSDGSTTPVGATGNTSSVFTISKALPFRAQCTICPNGQCYPYDSGN